MALKLSSRTVRGAVIACLTVAAAAVPISALSAAAGGTSTGLDTVTGTVASGVRGGFQTDGTCPLTTNPTFPGVQDPSEVFAMSMLHGHRAELLSLHICWAVTGALGGDTIDHGRFTLDTRDGTLSGNVSGSEGNERLEQMTFFLRVHASTGTLPDDGALSFRGCSDGSRIVAGNLVRGKVEFPPAPSACNAS